MNYEQQLPHEAIIYQKAVDRARDNDVDVTHRMDIIIFLEKEIDRYRDKIMYLENVIKEQAETMHAMKARIIALHGDDISLEAVQETTMTAVDVIIRAISESGYNISINLFKNDESED